MRSELREASAWGAWYIAFVALFVIVIGVIGFTGGIWGRVIDNAVDREIFEHSYQREASLDAKVATFTAQLAQIDVQLSNPDLSDEARVELQAQRAALQVQIETARIQQNQ